MFMKYRQAARLNQMHLLKLCMKNEYYRIDQLTKWNKEKYKEGIQGSQDRIHGYQKAISRLSKLIGNF